MEGAPYDAIKPLLEAQPLIKSVEWSASNPGVDYDLSTFRHDHILGESLTHWQARHIGVDVDTAPWLTNIEPREGLRDCIIAARSERYQNWTFPWPQIVAENRDRILFIGLPKEHLAFCKLLGPVQYLPTETMLDVAEVILGSMLLISNQTAACWVGLGLGHPLVQEQSPVTRDSMLPRHNAQYILHGQMPVIPARQISVALKPPVPKPLAKPLIWR